jgi:hypothetical protein
MIKSEEGKSSKNVMNKKYRIILRNFVNKEILKFWKWIDALFYLEFMIIDYM